MLYQKNIEAVCSTEVEVRHQIRQTLITNWGTTSDDRGATEGCVAAMLDHAPIAPRFVLCQSMRHRPPAIGTQMSFFSGVPFACDRVRLPFRRNPACAESAKPNFLKLDGGRTMAQCAQQCKKVIPSGPQSHPTRVTGGRWAKSPKSSNVPRSRVRRGLAASTRTPQIGTS